MSLLSAHSGYADERVNPAPNVWQELAEQLSLKMAGLSSQMPELQDQQLEYEFYRALAGNMSFAYIHLFLSDIQHPDFAPVVNQASPLLALNPDSVYYIVPIDSSGVYEISGFRGTVRMVEFQIGGGTFIPRGTAIHGPTTNNYRLDTLTIGEGGEFSVVLSAERPANYSGARGRSCASAGESGITYKRLQLDC